MHHSLFHRNIIEEVYRCFTSSYICLYVSQKKIEPGLTKRTTVVCFVCSLGKGKESDPTDASADVSANASVDSRPTVG